ncbi:hypothetical protein BU24DRAFT_492015 [Aaosphaeria arxii CBS 175.79]|uniref:Uncharacterized protein n=1 Tax=Aaosphaeria arxii CBS 175.79 TaxID=1450172 RepID=A0A6A5XSD7_9PLEO|nr:uncharacterized protein BU24DRAFT_492015 [Aaosphaeria arxii CBS 175.79]KAF2015819.1 hypothetical protein BU24DRAFT_492015 [Aaosphaeria arxii CBS 175.79]
MEVRDDFQRMDTPHCDMQWEPTVEQSTTVADGNHHSGQQSPKKGKKRKRHPPKRHDLPVIHEFQGVDGPTLANSYEAHDEENTLPVYCHTSIPTHNRNRETSSDTNEYSMLSHPPTPLNPGQDSPRRETFDLVHLLNSNNFRGTLSMFSKRLDLLHDQISLFETIKLELEILRKAYSGNDEAKYYAIIKRIEAYDNVARIAAMHFTDVLVHKLALCDVIEQTEFEMEKEVRGEIKKARKELEELMRRFEVEYCSELEGLEGSLEEGDD